MFWALKKHRNVCYDYENLLSGHVSRLSALQNISREEVHAAGNKTSHKGSRFKKFREYRKKRGMQLENDIDLDAYIRSFNFWVLYINFIQVQNYGMGEILMSWENLNKFRKVSGSFIQA